MESFTEPTLKPLGTQQGRDQIGEQQERHRHSKPQHGIHEAISLHAVATENEGDHHGEDEQTKAEQTGQP
jgi:hypothetical protein